MRRLATEKRLFVLCRVLEGVMPYVERLELWHPLVEVLVHVMVHGSV